MKKIILFFTIVVSNLAFGQEILSINQNDLANSTLKLSHDWMLEIDNQQATIKNGKISNSSSQSSGKMNLELYFSSAPLDLNSDQMEGFLVSTFNLKAIKGNSSFAGVNIQFKDQKIPSDGKYFPVLLLTQSGKIKDIVQINRRLKVQNNIVSIFNEIEEAKNTTTDTSGITDPNAPVEITVKNDNSITLEGEWKLDIDFKNFLVSILGGNIANNSSQDVDHLKIDVFLTKEKQTAISQNFDGLLIGSVPFESPIKAKNTFVDTSLKTNLRAIPSEGQYYILMTVSEIGSDGKTYMKSYRAFENPITLY